MTLYSFRWCLAGFQVFAAALWVFQAQVRAQPTGAGAARAPEATQALVPPQLIAQSEAAYPPGALQQRLEASVLLLLTIDANGVVTQAEVLEPAGSGFDEAAQEAALRFHFSPALNAGQPTAARIRYRYAFELPEPEPVTPIVIAPPELRTTEAPEQPVEVSVQGQKSPETQLQHAAEAVFTVNLRTARQQTADLGEVLARTPGISVEREAGLGSNSKISLAGLQGAQVKLFVDSIPLDEAGYPSLADIPVNLVERIEIYRGVVPIRFGSDALGGAINVVTNRSAHSHIGASYQVGAFNTHRATLSGRYQDTERHLVAGVTGFFDYTENSYQIDVSIPGPDGRPVPTRVRRSHDDYRAGGATVEVGVIGLPWARRLTLTGFANALFKEYQSNASMTVPYGELRGYSSEYGATLRYEVDFGANLSLEVLANYARNNDHFIDLSEWVYGWYGNRIRKRRMGGEINTDRRSDLRTWEDALFGRAILQWSLTPAHIVRLASSPATPWRGGHEAVVIQAGQRDKGDGLRRMVTIVSGLEYEANLFEERVANSAFLKHYWQHNTGEDPIYFVPGDVWKTRTSSVNRFGLGDSLRYRVARWLYTRASYEYAARLPEPEEYLGDGMMIGANYALQPEVSHNGNLGARAELTELPIGELTVDVNGFVRETDNLIMLWGLQGQQYNINVNSSRSYGVDSALTYLSPGRFVALNGMLSWQDLRNTSDRGDYAKFNGQRIASRPWLFASWGARLSFPNLLMRQLRIEPFYNARYVHSFSRTWEDFGDPQYKTVMPPQMTHNVGVTWVWSSEAANMSLTFEVDNFTDAKAYDFFGAQRAGRAFYAKITGDLR